MTKIISISVRDFAVPVPRRGSIEAHSGFGRSALEGQEIHLRVQQKRKAVDPLYFSEVKMEREFVRDDYTFRIGGRVDGLFKHQKPKIEEIKTSFRAFDLLRKLRFGNDHPYQLQLRTYGYFYWLENQVIPDLSFHLVSTRKDEFEDLKIDLSLSEYEVWMELRLAELLKEAKQGEKRVLRRKKIAKNFEFPFERPRQGQHELIASIEEGINQKQKMLIQAPTGLGKTAGVLYPALKEALSRGQSVVYVTPKNSQHSVAEDAISRFQEKGASVKSLTLTAKSKLCFKDEPICHPDYCEYARDYYSKVYDYSIQDILSRKKKLHSKVFRDLGEEYQVCPYELQLEAVQEADTLICDYNYVFAPRSTLTPSEIIPVGQIGKPNLVVDEAHNLPSRAIDYYSPSLSTVTLEKMREDILGLPKRFQKETEEFLDLCIQVIIAVRPEQANKSALVQLNLQPFLEQDLKLKSFLSKYIESNPDIQPRDSVLRLCFYWSEFTETLNFIADSSRKEFFTFFHPHVTGGILQIICCDPSAMLQPCYESYDNTISFSATLKPFQYYAQLSGLPKEGLITSEFQSPFAKAHRKLVIIPQISTKFSNRERNYPRVAEVIQKIVPLRKGNYFVFFPSFDFMERVLEKLIVPEGFEVLKQFKDMKSSDIEVFLNHLKQQNTPTLLFAVQGGVFSEGVDYPGKMIIGAFVVGPPLPPFDLEREQMRSYYEKNFSAGFDYAYTFPAMAKAVQSAGRVIRSETDRGLIVLVDERFIQPSYAQVMPKDWFESSPQELVSKSILKEISEFWSHVEGENL